MKTRVFRASSALWVNGFATGLLYFSISSLSTLIGADLGFSDTQLSVLFSLPTFMYVVSGWLPGTVVDRIGVKRSVPITFALIWASALIKLVTKSYAVFVLLTVLQSIGIMLSSPTTSKAIKALDSANTAKILGLVNTGMTIGTWTTHTFALSLARSMSSGWRGASIVFLFATLLLGSVACTLFVRLRPPLEPPEEQARASAPEEKPGLFDGRRRENLILIGVAVLYFGTLATNFSLNNWLPKLLTYGGFSAVVSARSASMYSLGSMFCSVGIPFLFPGLPNKVALPIPASVLVVGLLFGLAAVSSPVLACVISMVIGMIIGSLQLMVQYQIVANSTPKVAGRYSAFVFFVGNAGATIAILGVGIIPENMFFGKILFIAAFSVASVIGGLLLASQKGRETA